MLHLEGFILISNDLPFSVIIILNPILQEKVSEYTLLRQKKKLKMNVFIMKEIIQCLLLIDLGFM